MVDCSRRSLIIGAPALVAYSSLMPVKMYEFNAPWVSYRQEYTDDLYHYIINAVQPFDKFKRLMRRKPLGKLDWNFVYGSEGEFLGARTHCRPLEEQWNGSIAHLTSRGNLPRLALHEGKFLGKLDWDYGRPFQTAYYYI